MPKDYFSPIMLTDGKSTLMLAMTDVVVMLFISIMLLADVICQGYDG